MEMKTQHQIEMDSYFAALDRHLASIQLEFEIEKAELVMLKAEAREAEAEYGRTLALAQALTGLSEEEIWQRIEN